MGLLTRPPCNFSKLSQTKKKKKQRTETKKTSMLPSASYSSTLQLFKTFTNPKKNKEQKQKKQACYHRLLTRPPCNFSKLSQTQKKTKNRNKKNKHVTIGFLLVHL